MRVTDLPAHLHAEARAKLAAVRASVPAGADPAPLEPLTLVVPFKALVSDNAKYGVIGGRMILTAAYRGAKDAVAALAMRAWRGRSPLAGRVMLDATLYEPNRARVRDPGNYRKLVTDALAGVCYHNDGQLDRETWRRGPIDAERPRLELTLTPEPGG